MLNSSVIILKYLLINMSSSEDEGHTKKAAKKGGKKTDKPNKVEYQIKPSSSGPSMDTSNWPLLLKVKPDSLFNSHVRTMIS